ncbi:hypothetical protein ABI59_21275 [Acidobacteria bacterium Mor1]|nr:hypothetical protein ABI59_21275 [Acidobacteria bacterium Mor1]
MKPDARLIVLLLSLLLALGALAQDDEPIRSSLFDTEEVRVVSIDVFVTDKKGNPIRQLTPDDFVVLHDGVPVDISNFYAGPGSEGAAAVPDEPAEMPIEATDPATAIATTPDEFESWPPVAERAINLVLLVDNLNLSPSNRKRVMKAVDEFLDNGESSPWEKVLVLSHDSELRVVQDWTSDVEKVRQALDGIGKVSPRGTQRQMDLRRILFEIQRAELAETGSGQTFSQDSSTEQARAVLHSIELYSREQYQNSRSAVLRLASFVQSMGGVPGRKALVYASDGLNARPGEALLDAWQRKFYSREREAGFVRGATNILAFDISPDIERLAEAANANRVTLYPVSAGAGRSTITPAERSMDRQSMTIRGGGLTWSNQTEAVQTSNNSSGLQLMAHATGGLAALRGGQFERMFERVRQDFESFYSLGYRHPGVQPGKRHRVEIKLKDENLKARLRYRRNFSDRTREQRASDDTLAALMHGAEDNPLDLSVHFESGTEDDEGYIAVPVNLLFPLNNIVLVPGEKHHEGRLRIFIATRNEDGGTSPVQRLDLPVRIANDQFLDAIQRNGRHKFTLRIKPGPHEVAVGLWDEVGDVTSTVCSKLSTEETSATR